MKKSTINYIIDIIIGLGFLASVVTGIFLIFNTSGGYQGGRNPQYFIHAMWINIHTWSSIIMSIGVAAHLILHWNWMVCMTRNLLSPNKGNTPGIQGIKTACDLDSTAVSS